MLGPLIFRVFLRDGEVPIDNNASERDIRGFCIGKKNWQMIDTINGAKTSAIIYSIVETAKANHLKPFAYVQYLLEEIPQHMRIRIVHFWKIFCHGQKNFRQRSAKVKCRWLRMARAELLLAFSLIQHSPLYIPLPLFYNKYTGFLFWDKVFVRKLWNAGGIKE